MLYQTVCRGPNRPAMRSRWMCSTLGRGGCRRGRRGFADRDGDRELLALTHDAEKCLRVDREGDELADEVAAVGDRGSVQGQDDVAGAEIGPGGRAVRGDIYHEDTARFLDLQGSPYIVGHVA